MADIQLSASVGAGGSFAILGRANVQIVGNADLVLSLVQYSNYFVQVTSDGTSAGVRNVIAPLNEGTTFVVQNKTSEGFAIVLKGPSGVGVSIPPLASALVATDGTNYFTPAAAGNDIVVADAAALTAYPAASLLNRQSAAVQTFGATFALGPAGPTVDGVTVIAASDGRVWMRGATLIAPAAQAQTAWFVDLNNSTGLASDQNTGLTALLPLLTKAEIARRWGSWSPTLTTITVTITYLGSDTATAGRDPGRFTPTFVMGARLLHTAALPATSFTGTLLAVTAKNPATNTPLRSTFTTTTGAVAATLLLVNATRGNSRAFAQRNTGAGIWQISQPMVPYVLGNQPASTEVDTWANGDAISGYALPVVDLANIGGQTVEYANPLGPSHVVAGLQVQDPGSAVGPSPFIVGGAAAAAFAECLVQRAFVSANGARASAQFGISPATAVSNCFLNADSVLEGPEQGSSPLVEGGVIKGFLATFRNATIQKDVILAAQVATWANTCIFGQVAVDTGSTLQLAGATGCSAAIYGGGACDCSQGLVKITTLTAVQTFRVTPITINAAASAYSNSTTAGLTTVHLVGLTAAAIDAAAGAAGFGGLAYIPGVGAFQKGIATP